MSNSLKSSIIDITAKILGEKDYLKYLFYLTKIIGDKNYLRHKFKSNLGYKLDFNNPKSYNEKLQWLKLYYRDPLLTTIVDKYAAKKWVADRIGDKYIILTLGVWDNFDSIDFDKLPEQFVLKTTHDSGSVVICKDKASFDKTKARDILSRSLDTEFYWLTKEYPYKDVPHRIIAEKYLEDESGELRDYKFFCFDGKMKAIFIATDRFTPGEDTKFDFFDENFNHLPFVNGHPNSTKQISKPDSFEKMKSLAEQLSEGFPHVRVDLYYVNGEIYFGEMTLFHWSGMVAFEPIEWDYTFGSWIKLPPKKKN